METSRHERVGKIFLEARLLAGDERQALLARVCGEEPDLRAEVESLLVADASETGTLLGERSAALGIKVADASGLCIGAHIGQYTIQRVLGTGGMGTVFEALQERPKRRVALKTIRLGIASPALMRRFEYEAQILARLQHPGIAQVHEAGIYESGEGSIPYIAMEIVVAGEPIHFYVRKAQLKLPELLVLFVRVCEAIEYAHRNGVIHRDLKPENVLVDSGGRPKIIDFGIAQISEAGQTMTTMHTSPGDVLGTVPYLAPEQVEGDSSRIDTRTDVYALGVILYEVVTGKLPYAVKDGLAEALDQVRHAEPTPPRVYVPSLSEEVETIVLKCLQKDRDRRYQSAGELGRDIEFYLAGEPIAAKRDSTWYVLRKTMHRYRLQATAALLIFGVALGSAVALGFMYSAQKTERRRAEEATQIAQNAGKEAVSARSLAEQRAKEAERQSYAAGIAAAHQAIAINDGGDALKRLAAVPERLRHWEWYYLQSQADLSNFTLPAPDRAAHVAFGSEGTLAVGYWSGAIRLWSIPGRTCVWEAKPFDRPVQQIAFVSNGTAVAAAIGCESWCLLDSKTGTEISRHERPDACGEARAIDPESPAIACALWNCGPAREYYGMIVYDMLTGEQTRSAPRLGNDRADSAATFHPAAGLLAIGDVTGAIHLWDLRSGQQRIFNQTSSSRIYGLAFTSDGQQLASGHENGTAYLWDLKSGTPNRLFQGHTQRIAALAFQPGDRRMVTASRDKSLRVWDVDSGTTEAILRGHESVVLDVVWSPDGDAIATTSFDGTVKVWTLDQVSAAPLRTRDQVQWLSFDDPGRRVLTVSPFDFVIWDAIERHPLNQISGSDWSTGVHCAEFSRDGSKIYVGGPAGNVRIVDADSLATVSTLGSHQTLVQAIALSPDGQRVASGDKDGHIILWNLNGGQHDLMGHTGQVYTMAFDPSGRRLASASTDGTVRLWDTLKGHSLYEYKEHKSTVFGVAFSPDGCTIASASQDGTIRLWNEGETIRVIDGKMQDVWSVAYSPDGARLVAGGRDGTARIWDADTGDELLILRGPTGTVMRVAWSPDGRRIAAGSWNRELFIWDVPSLARSPSVQGLVTSESQ